MLNMSSEHYPALAPRAPRHFSDLPDALKEEGAEILDVITKGEDVYFLYTDGYHLLILPPEAEEPIILSSEGVAKEYIHAVMNNRIFISPKGDGWHHQFVFDANTNKARQVRFDEYCEPREDKKPYVKSLGDSLYQIDVLHMDAFLEAGDDVRVTFPSGAGSSNGGDRICLVQSVNPSFLIVYTPDSEMLSCSLTVDVRLQREGIRLDYVTAHNNRLFGVAKYEKLNEPLYTVLSDAQVGRGDDFITVKCSGIDLLKSQEYSGKSFFIQGDDSCTIAKFSPRVGVSRIDFDQASEKFKALVGWTDSDGKMKAPSNVSVLNGKTFVSFEETERVDTIFASGLGSPASWMNYDGTSMASYYASVASDSEWTGIKAFDGAVWCFKEDSVFQFYGTEPANFGYTEIKYTGIKKGSSASAHIIGTTMFYHSRDGIAALSSGSFGITSQKLGDKELENVKCSSLANRLYVAAEQGGESVLYVLDTEKGLWHKEDKTKVFGFVKVGEDLRFISDGKLFSVNKNIGDRENVVHWMAETGNIGLYMDGYKRIVKLNLRAQIPLDGEIVVEISHDDGEYETVKRISGRGIGMTTVPVYPRRCDHFKLKFRGTGDCRIISLVKTVEGGSDVGK